MTGNFLLFFFVSREPFVKFKMVLFLWCGVSKIWHKSYCMVGNFCKGHFSQVESHLPLVSCFIFFYCLVGFIWNGDLRGLSKAKYVPCFGHHTSLLGIYAYGWGWTQLKFVHTELFYCLVWNGEGGIWQLSSLVCYFVTPYLASGRITLLTKWLVKRKLNTFASHNFCGIMKL